MISSHLPANTPFDDQHQSLIPVTDANDTIEQLLGKGAFAYCLFTFRLVEDAKTVEGTELEHCTAIAEATLKRAYLSLIKSLTTNGQVTGIRSFICKTNPGVFVILFATVMSKRDCLDRMQELFLIENETIPEQFNKLLLGRGLQLKVQLTQQVSFPEPEDVRKQTLDS